MSAARRPAGVTRCVPEPAIRGRRVAILASDGVDEHAVATITRALTARGATVQLVAPRPGVLRTATGVELHVDHSLITTRSLSFDAVFIPGGDRCVRELRWDPRAWVFLTEACEAGRSILAVGSGVDLFDRGVDDRLAVCREGRVVLAPEGATSAAIGRFILAMGSESEARARRTPTLAVAMS